MKPKAPRAKKRPGKKKASRREPRLALPNNCSATPPAVIPSDWDDNPASIDREWIIYYRFYDPSHVDPHGELIPKLVRLRNMNDVHDWKQRKELTQSLLDNLIYSLEIEGFNPRLGMNIIPRQETIQDIPPSTPLSAALESAFIRLKGIPAGIRNVKYNLGYIQRAIREIGLEHFPVGQVSKKHIQHILDRCALDVVLDFEKEKHLPKNERKRRAETWTACMHNHFRSDLMRLFTTLGTIEAVTHNPVKDVPKMTEIDNIRRTLEDEQRTDIDKLLKNQNPDFQRFIHIYFASETRLTELYRIKYEHVHLKKNQVDKLILKGAHPKWTFFTIQDSVMPLWEELMAMAQPGDYIFSREFKPGPEQVSSERPMRKWCELVKKRLKINVDIATLRHTGMTESKDKLEQAAPNPFLDTPEVKAAMQILSRAFLPEKSSEIVAAQTGHDSTEMIDNVYDVKRKDRRHEKIKKINTKFA